MIYLQMLKGTAVIHTTAHLYLKSCYALVFLVCVNTVCQVEERVCFFCESYVKCQYATKFRKKFAVNFPVSHFQTQQVPIKLLINLGLPGNFRKINLFKKAVCLHKEN
jgi:hypothetical protein